MDALEVRYLSRGHFDMQSWTTIDFAVLFIHPDFLPLNLVALKLPECPRLLLLWSPQPLEASVRWRCCGSLLNCCTSWNLVSAHVGLCFSLLLQTASQILSSPVLNHALLFVNKSSEDFDEIFSAFSSTAETFRMKVHKNVFVILRALTTNVFLAPDFDSVT